MRYAKIRKQDIANGEGIGVALFVQGCHFHCRGCFNSETWDFNGGKRWTEEVENKFMDLIAQPFIQRVSLLGGECLDEENIDCILELVKRIKKQYRNDRKIWLYTGYDAKSIVNGFDSKMKEVLEYCDYVVDGRFIQGLKNKNLKFRGSSNQHIYKIQKFSMIKHPTKFICLEEYEPK